MLQYCNTLIFGKLCAIFVTILPHYYNIYIVWLLLQFWNTKSCHFFVATLRYFCNIIIALLRHLYRRVSFLAHLCNNINTLLQHICELFVSKMQLRLVRHIFATILQHYYLRYLLPITAKTLQNLQQIEYENTNLSHRLPLQILSHESDFGAYFPHQS